MNQYKQNNLNVTSPIGVAVLDLRVAEVSHDAAAHHQKMMVIRGADKTHVAFCGGVDLAYTRRDAPNHPEDFDPKTPRILQGDWESGNNVPPTTTWPHQQADVDYPTNVSPPTHRQASDLPVEIYGNSKLPDQRQIWHDQHLKLEGPIVVTIEEQFCERWRDTTGLLGWRHNQPSILALPKKKFDEWMSGQAYFSTDMALGMPDPGSKTPPPILPLRDPMTPIPTSDGSSSVQLWRTIPVRSKRTGPPFTRGEFTAMAGIARACNAATELIWIFDQYFWSRPLARLLNSQVSKQGSKLCVLVVLPPIADLGNTIPGVRQHYARKLALTDLTAGFSHQGNGQFGRIAIYNLWDLRADPRGIYCHAKTQLYDNDLLVCGSANLNRRSFTCDTEIACAVLDSDVVSQHRDNLWRLVLPHSDPPKLDLQSARMGPGILQYILTGSRGIPAITKPIHSS
jgi:phosphatidylserine/phosphatidylglycerophosphate/cardiolipin synthase-like enzyme